MSDLSSSGRGNGNGHDWVVGRERERERQKRKRRENVRFNVQYEKNRRNCHQGCFKQQGH